MSCSWKGKCLILSLLALIFISEAARSLPKAYNWEQMLPKKLPTPPSSPSKGTNSFTSSETTSEIDPKLNPSDTKV